MQGYFMNDHRPYSLDIKPSLTTFDTLGTRSQLSKHISAPTPLGNAQPLFRKLGAETGIMSHRWPHQEVTMRCSQQYGHTVRASSAVNV